jgi:hypothetical protein
MHKMLEPENIRLRPHHLLCTRFFEGKGYSNDFTLRMAEVIERLQAGAAVELVDGRDEICGNCPNMIEGRCKTQEKVLHYDAGVMERTGLTYGDVQAFSALYELVGEKIIRPGVMKEICGDCSWSRICYRE